MVMAKNLLKTDFVKADINDTVSDFIGKISSKKQTFAVVYDGKNYKGMLDRKFLMTSRIDPSKMRLNNIMKHASKRKTPFFVPKLSPDTGTEEICKLFAASSARALPVFEKEKLLGIVTARSILREIRAYYRGLPVKELSSKKSLVIAKESDETGKIINAMHMKNVDRIPVVDKSGRISGIVTMQDVMKNFHSGPKSGQRMSANSKHGRWASSGCDHGERQDLLKLPVSNIMTPYADTFCTDTKSTVSQALDMMINDDINSVIVTENDMPVGIITLQDIMQDYAKE